jgi:7-keto-8-aminopelargonate synthetase-like enzyme
LEISEYLSVVESVHSEARRAGLFFQNCQDTQLNDRNINLSGNQLLAFASCSYMGLEQHPEVINGVHQAVDSFGTQFPTSRGYMSSPLYEELEEAMSNIFDAHALVTSCTTLGHQIALGALVTEKDAIVLDHQAHYSVQMAAMLARSNGAKMELVKHGELERALEVVEKRSRTARNVYFAVDGVFSMFGDLAPIGLLHQVLDVAPNVRLYVDDAHGMSWTGKNGQGSFLSRIPFSERIVLATSMSKGFGAAGGCLLFSSAEEREWVRLCGGPLVFSIPVPPPMLGAAMASARLHLSAEIYDLQRQYRERVDLCNQLIREAELPLLVENESPIFFLKLGSPSRAFTVAQRMREEGIYVTPSVYPTVPLKRAGIRLSVTVAHSLDDIKRVIGKLAEHIPAVLRDEGVTESELDRLFERAVPKYAQEMEAMA